jgi:hypothetical protein
MEIDFKKSKFNKFLITQYCSFLRKIYQEIAHDSKIPGYATRRHYKLYKTTQKICALYWFLLVRTFLYRKVWPRENSIPISFVHYEKP